MTDRPDDPIVRLISALVEGNVEFIVVGGAAAVLAGVPVVTKDLDIVHRRTADNIEKLMGVLGKLDAHFRPDFANRKLQPRASDLAGHGHLGTSPWQPCSVPWMSSAKCLDSAGLKSCCPTRPKFPTLT